MGFGFGLGFLGSWGLGSVEFRVREILLVLVSVAAVEGLGFWGLGVCVWGAWGLGPLGRRLPCSALHRHCSSLVWYLT